MTHGSWQALTCRMSFALTSRVIQFAAPGSQGSPPGDEGYRRVLPGTVACILSSVAVIYSLIEQVKDKMATTEKKKRGKWKAGERGNPNGRPPGVGEVTKLRDSIAAHLPEIITQLVTKAKEAGPTGRPTVAGACIAADEGNRTACTLSLPDGEGITAKGWR